MSKLLFFTAGMMMGFLSIRFLSDPNFSTEVGSYFMRAVKHEVKHGLQHVHTGRHCLKSLFNCVFIYACLMADVFVFPFQLKQ